MVDIISNPVTSENKSTEVFFDNLIWMTTKEAAEYLRVSVGSMKNLVYRGVVVPRKLGKLNRYRREDLDKLLESSLTKGGF